MLAKAPLLLLGIIDQTEINAYELIKVLKNIKVHEWFRIAESTVYMTLKKLSKNGLIYGCTVKDNNMPEKIYYNVTEKGKIELLNSIEEILSDFSYDPLPFLIASFFITILEKERAIELLKKRLSLLEKYKQGIELQIENIENHHAMAIYICNIKHNKMIIDTEIEVTNVFIKEIINTQTWNIDVLKKIITE